MFTELNDKLEIFLSYKETDKEAANKLATALEFIGRNRIKVFIAAKLDSGKTWPEAIHKQLHDADWLILLYTDPTDDWDWCMYETGFFTACNPKLESSRRVVCLRPVNCPPPNPLAQRKSVQATNDDVEKFLRDLLTKPPKKGAAPIYPELFSNPDLKDECQQQVKKIVKLVAPASENIKESQYVAPKLQLTIPFNATEDAKRGKIAAVSSVLLDHISAISVFSNRQTKFLWRDFLLMLEKDPDLRDWGNDLVKSVARAANGETKVLPLPVLRPKNSSYAYRAILYQKDELMNGSVRFHVVFALTPPGIKPDSERVSDRVFSALSLTQQFCWLVLDKSMESILIASGLGRGLQEKLHCIQNVSAAVDLVRREAHIRHVFAGTQVADLFKGSTIPVNDVHAAINKLSEAIKGVKTCLDISDTNACTYWKTFKDHVECMKNVCTFLLGAIAFRLSELNPQQAVPVCPSYQKTQQAE